MASPPPNGFVRFTRKVYHPLGFKKGYNFTLWFIFAGALFGFTLARLQYLSVGGIFHNGAAPGEWFWMRNSFRRVGITMHLATILPAVLLVIFQFVPTIRYKALLFHRMSGYIILLLLLLSNAGALMVARHSFGGGFETQVLVGLLVLLTTLGAALAYYNIKRLQIDQHRAWMLRTWFYAASIITLRIIMIISTSIVSKTETAYRALPCDQIAFTYADKGLEGFEAAYPQCLSANSTTDGWVAVKVQFKGGNTMEIGNSLYFTFGTAGWLALFLHGVGVEIYLWLTPREGERLRNVSYQRQLEAGFSHPGSSGITADRLGDADPWPAPKPSDGEK